MVSPQGMATPTQEEHPAPQRAKWLLRKQQEVDRACGSSHKAGLGHRKGRLLQALGQPSWAPAREGEPTNLTAVREDDHHGSPRRRGPAQPARQKPGPFATRAGGEPDH